MRKTLLFVGSRLVDHIDHTRPLHNEEIFWRRSKHAKESIWKRTQVFWWYKRRDWLVWYLYIDDTYVFIALQERKRFTRRSWFLPTVIWSRWKAMKFCAMPIKKTSLSLSLEILSGVFPHYTPKEGTYPWLRHSATTHTDIILRARSLKIPTRVIHNASIMNAAGACGLQLYNFGHTVSLVFFTETWKPDSFYDRIKENADLGMHTLLLLDIKVKEQSEENLAR